LFFIIAKYFGGSVFNKYFTKPSSRRFYVESPVSHFFITVVLGTAPKVLPHAEPAP
jgi:hypothetical protein